MTCRLIFKSIFFLALAVGFTNGWLSTTWGNEAEQLLPRLGETTREFEARKRGVPAPGPASEPNSVTVFAGAGGHFYVESTVNGSQMRMMIDTGATVVALTKDDARRIGFYPSSSDFNLTISTANGNVRAAPVVLKEVTIGEISVRNVVAVVQPDNLMRESLLGMSFLSKLSHFEISGGRLVLRQ
jgi:aspartyl protease family protein